MVFILTSSTVRRLDGRPATCQALVEAQQRAEAAADEIAEWMERREVMEAERVELAAAVGVSCLALTLESMPL